MFYYFNPLWVPPICSPGQDNDTAVLVAGGNGPPGPPGPQGPEGPQGSPGANGEPGVSVTKAEIQNPTGELVLYLSDGSIVYAGDVVGPPGPSGMKGEKGEKGEESGSSGSKGDKGNKGESGSKGDAGESGSCANCNSKTVLTGSNYYCEPDDFYVGVNSKEATTVYLPEDVGDGKIVVVKAEMTPPLGNRKITIKTTDGSFIDGYSELVIQVSHEYVWVIFRGDEWHVIG